MAEGYNQKYGQDYYETYCSVVQIMTTRLMLNYAAAEKLHMRQFDIKTSFLHAELEEEVYMATQIMFGGSNAPSRASNRALAAGI